MMRLPLSPPLLAQLTLGSETAMGAADARANYPRRAGTARGFQAGAERC